MDTVEHPVAVGAASGEPVIEFPPDSPHDPDLTKLVEGIARDTYSIDVPTMKVFFYVDDKLEIFETDPVDRDGFLHDWFGDYYDGHRSQWEESRVVVYSDSIAGLNQVRYHVVIGADLPVYALCINRDTGEAQWYLQETPAATLLASKKRK